MKFLAFDNKNLTYDHEVYLIHHELMGLTKKFWTLVSQACVLGLFGLISTIWFQAPQLNVIFFLDTKKVQFLSNEKQKSRHEEVG